MNDVTIETYGCSVNKSDSETMAGILAERGLEVCDDGRILILNTCTVKTPTENKILRRLRELERSGKKVIVAGCLPAADPGIADRFPKFSFLGTNILDIADAVESESSGKRMVKICSGECISGKPKVRENPVVGIVPISRGCLGKCSYCIVKNVRGKLKSYPEEEILAEVERAVDQGAKEIWLTSQDTGAYGLDSGTNLVDLLGKVPEIEGDYMVRVGMMNPNHVLAFLDGLVPAYENEKIFKFLHLPVQSGDDRVLRDMKRQYTVRDFRTIVKEFRKRIPEITLSTDIICGFPTEDEEAFRNSLELIREIKPSVLNSTRFWSRPGTEAAGMEQLHGRVTNQRSRKLALLFKSIALDNNRKWIGWKGKAVVSEKAKKKGFCARNYAYKPIIIDSEKDLLGKAVMVKVDDATSCDLRARIIPQS